jgi:hypothetical protein
VLRIVGHFLAATMLMYFFCHLIAAQQLPDRLDRQDLKAENSQEQYGQKFPHEPDKDNVNQSKRILRPG